MRQTIEKQHNHNDMDLEMSIIALEQAAKPISSSDKADMILTTWGRLALVDHYIAVNALAKLQATAARKAKAGKVRQGQMVN